MRDSRSFHCVGEVSAHLEILRIAAERELQVLDRQIPILLSEVHVTPRSAEYRRIHVLTGKLHHLFEKAKGSVEVQRIVLAEDPRQVVGGFGERRVEQEGDLKILCRQLDIPSS